MSFLYDQNVPPDQLLTILSLFSRQYSFSMPTMLTLQYVIVACYRR